MTKNPRRDDSPLERPSNHEGGTDWFDRVQTAKEAWEQGRKAREGKGSAMPDYPRSLPPTSERSG